MSEDTTDDYEPDRTFADVEIFVRPQGDWSRSADELVFEASYEEMARLSSPTVVDMMADYELDTGAWRVGIRERGDEQYFQDFRIAELEAQHEPTAELQNRVAGVLNHWRA
jgi:hypothetical protein